MTSRPLAREILALRRLLGLVHAHLWFLPAAVALGLLAFAAEGLGLALFVPLLHAFGSPQAVDGSAFLAPLLAAVDSAPADWRIALVVLAMLAAITLKNLIQYANTALFVVADARASDALRQRAFARIMGMPLAAVERDSSGRLLNAIGTETWRVSQALATVFGAVTSLCALLVFLALMLLLSWRLTLVAMALMALIPLVMHRLTRHTAELGRRAVAVNSGLAERMWGAIAGIRVIRAFGREADEVARFGRASSAVRGVFTRLALVTSATGPATEVLITAIIAALALAIDPTRVDLATLVAFVAVLYRLQPHARQLIHCRAALLGFAGAVDELSAVVEAPPDPVLARGGRRFPGLRQEIRVEGLSFTHPGNAEPALDDVTFAIPRGTTLAIVGPSGAGKSTLLDLLLGFHDPDRGRILIDGTPLQELDVASWREHLAVVSQDPYLADATVRDNLLYGRPEASPAELEAAAEAAHALEFIRRLPQGFDTMVGERGVRLSGGQRQRLALARALVRAPDLLLLDEATNALDSFSESAVQEALARCAGRVTMLIVAHRLATIERADLIVVLDQGRVVEQGDFAGLVRADGLFAQMYRLQRLGRGLRKVA